MPRTGGPERREAILEEAVRQFGRVGYAATSLDEIARGVGIRKQSLLYYYPTKDDLFASAAVHAAEAVADALDRSLRDGPDSLERLETLVAEAHKMAARSPEVIALIREVARHGPPLSDTVASALRPLVDAAAQWLDRAMDEGVVRRQNPRVALLTIYSAVVGHLTESSVKRAVLRERDRRVAERELVAFIRSALSP